MPLAVLGPTVLLKERVLVVGLGLNLAPVARFDQTAGVDQPSRVSDGSSVEAVFGHTCQAGPTSTRRQQEVVVSKIKPCLWFDGQAEEAANFYVSLLPDSRINDVAKAQADTPSGPAGIVLTVDFTLAGSDFQGLNGGPEFKFTEAVSFSVDCADQAEVDRLWDALTANGGEPGP